MTRLLPFLSAFLLSTTPTLAGPFGLDLKKNPLDVYPNAVEAFHIKQKTGEYPKYCDEHPTNEEAISCTFGVDPFSNSKFKSDISVLYKENKGICKIHTMGRTTKYKLVKNKYDEYDLVEVNLGMPTTLASKIANQFRKKYGPHKTRYVYFDDDHSKGLKTIYFFWFLGSPASNNHGVNSINIASYNPDPEKDEDSIYNQGSIYITFHTNDCGGY